MNRARSITTVIVAGLMCVCSAYAAVEPPHGDESVWATAPYTTFEAIKKDPEAHVGKVYTFSGGIGVVNLTDKRKSFKVREAGPKPKGGWSEFAPKTGTLFEVLINSWYAEKAKSIEGRAEVRYLAQFSRVDPSTPFGGAQHDFVGIINIYGNTFEPYVELVAIRPHDPRVFGNRGRTELPQGGASGAAPGTSTPSLTRRPTKSAILAKAESQVRFSEYFVEHTIRTETDHQSVVLALKKALRELKEEVQEDRSTDVFLITKRKKHGFLATPRQMAIAVEPSDDGGTLISFKVAHSLTSGSGTENQPVQDQQWIAKNDRELLSTLSQALEKFGVRIRSD